ncbi:unnamed protein product, partial [Prorocentrum cordatum]
DAAAPPPPRVPEYTDGDLDRLAALEQTALAKEVEQATKQERLAAQEVQWRLGRYNKAKATLEEMQRNRVEAERNLEMARQAVREADAKNNRFNIGQFNIGQFEEVKRAEVERQRQAAAAAEREAQDGFTEPRAPAAAPAAGAGGGARWDGGGDGADAGRGVPEGAGAAVAALRPPDHLQMTLDDIREWCQKHGHRYEYWEAVKQMEQSIAAPMDDVSEVGEFEFGDHHRYELDQLRKRSLEQALTEAECNRMETILVKQAAQKATKRLRTVRCKNEVPWFEVRALR